MRPWGLRAFVLGTVLAPVLVVVSKIKEADWSSLGHLLLQLYMGLNPACVTDTGETTEDSRAEFKGDDAPATTGQVTS